MTATETKASIQRRIDEIKEYDAGLRSEMEKMAEARGGSQALYATEWWRDREELLAAHAEDLKHLQQLQQLQQLLATN